MRKIILLTSIYLSSCGIQQMNDNMQRTNELMYQNMQEMETSRKCVEENTKEIKRSIAGMREFQVFFPLLFSSLLLLTLFIHYKFLRK